MKNQTLITLLLTTLFLSCKKDIVEFQPTNPFENIVIVEKQLFDLDTLSTKEIIGKKGTKIYFNREDFDINKNDKVTVELKEYYSRLELISDNLNTITDNNELLESNGVIYLSFKVGDKKIKLKEGKKLPVTFTNAFKADDRIFNGVLDSVDQIKWVKNSDAKVLQTVFDSVLSKKYGGVNIFSEKLVSLDSVEYYNRQIDQLQRESIADLKNIGYYPIVLLDTFEWINVDSVLNINSTISFELILNKTDLEKISVFFIYKDVNSFISEYRNNLNLKFTDIPLVNECSMIIVGEKGKDIYANRSILSKEINGKLEIDLKKVDSLKLKDILLK